MKCSVSTCDDPADVLIRFTSSQREWPYCRYHDARAPRRRRGWPPWIIASVRRL